MNRTMMASPVVGLVVRLTVALAAVGAAGCSIDDLDTSGLQLTCERGGCPSGWTCQEDNTCVPPDGDLPAEGGGKEGGQGVEGEQAEGAEGEGEGGVIPDPAVSLRLVDAPSETTAGAPFSVSVEVVSETGEIVETFAGVVQVSVERDGTPVELWGVGELEAAAGVADFEGLSLTLAGAGTELVARFGELAEARSDEFDVLPGPPAELRFLQEPSNARTSQPILPLVQVGLVDGFGNASTPAEPVAVNLALAVDPTTGRATLGGAAANTAEGVATFPNLELNRAGAGYHLSADATGFPQRVSARFSVGGAGAPDLVLTMGASGGLDIYEDIVAGSNGFIAIGTFAGEHRIGDATITSVGGTDGIVARFDAEGELLWATRFGGVDDDEGLRLSLTDGGEIVRIAGQVRGAAGFERSGEEGIVLGHPSEGQRMFMATLRFESGAVISAYEATSSALTLNDMACTLAGDCYLTGSFDTGVTLRGNQGTSHEFVPISEGGDDAFFARFSPSGELLWGQRGGSGGNNEAGIAVTVGNPSFPTFVGTVKVPVQGRAVFGPDGAPKNILWTQGIDVFVLRLNSKGAVDSIISFGGEGTDRPTAVLTTDSGLLVGGTTDGAISIEHLPGFQPRGGEDGFVLSVSFDLEARWIRVIGGENEDGVRALALAPAGGDLTAGIIVAGVFRGRLPLV